jgi:hypothetical protein
MTGWEKFSAILMSIITIVPMLAMAFTKESKASLAAMSAAIAHAIGLETEAAAARGTAAAMWSLIWPIGLVVAAIAGLVAIIGVVSNAMQAGEIAAKKAAESA